MLVRTVASLCMNEQPWSTVQRRLQFVPQSITQKEFVSGTLVITYISVELNQSRK